MLNNKLFIWLELNKDEFIAFFKLVLPFILFVFFLWKIPFWLRNYSFSKLDTETIGVIDSIQGIREINDSNRGGELVIKSYHLEYNYSVEGQRIERTELINKNSLEINQRVLLKKLSVGDSISIRYNSEKINHSKVLLK